MTLLEILKNPKATLVDVRTPMEFADKHAEGAINIPLDEIPGRLSELKSLSRPVIYYCRSGARSANAVMYLKANGLTDIYDGGGLSNILMLKMNA